jgi:hypothetical protein
MRRVQSVRLSLVVVGALAACGDDGGHQHVQSDAAPGDAPPVNMTTALTAMLNASRTLDNAGYGVNADDGTLHVEIHKGGFSGCPEMNSPTPEYTLILGRVPAMTASTATSPATFLDFVGDMTDNSPAPSSATAKTLTNVAYSMGAFLAFDVNLTFAEGTITGHLYALYCPSLDG